MGKSHHVNLEPNKVCTSILLIKANPRLLAHPKPELGPVQEGYFMQLATGSAVKVLDALIFGVFSAAHSIRTDKRILIGPAANAAHRPWLLRALSWWLYLLQGLNY